MVTKAALTLDEFLALPETEPPSEFIDGEVVQKVSPTWFHGALVQRLIRRIGNHLEDTGEPAELVTELRHATRTPEERSFLPDITVMRDENIPRDRDSLLRGPVWIPPDFAIEVLSPGDSPGRVLERVDFYMDIGTQLVWLVDPELKTVVVHRPGEQPRVHRAPSTLDAQPVLSSFSLSLDDLFAVLPRDDQDT